jgi:hypothetical protein
MAEKAQKYFPERNELNSFYKNEKLALKEEKKLALGEDENWKQRLKKSIL